MRINILSVFRYIFQTKYLPRPCSEQFLLPPFKTSAQLLEEKRVAGTRIGNLRQKNVPRKTECTKQMVISD